MKEPILDSYHTTFPIIYIKEANMIPRHCYRGTKCSFVFHLPPTITVHRCHHRQYHHHHYHQYHQIAAHHTSS